MLIENEHICLNICEDFSVQCEAEGVRFIKTVQAVDATVMVFACLLKKHYSVLLSSLGI